MGIEGFQSSFNLEGQVCAFLDFAGITFRYGKFHFKWCDFRQFGDDGCGGGVSSQADLPQSDDAVERGPEFRHGNVCFHILNVGVEGSQFRFYLFVRFFAHCITLQQGILTEHTVFGQWHLGFQPFQLGLQLAVVHFGQQLAFGHERALREINARDFSGGLKRQVHFFIRHQFAADKQLVGEQVRFEYFSIYVECFGLASGYLLLGCFQFFVLPGGKRVNT